MPHRAVRAAVTVPTRPALVTVRDVELMEVGTWDLSTGVTTFTVEDLASAIEAVQDPAVRAPSIKLGHVDPRFDGEPALGKVENMRLSEDGLTLLGDLVGVPAWLADIMASAYPTRSIEGNFNYTTATGNTHRFILTGLALLSEYPGVQTLEDIPALYDGTLVASRRQSVPVRLTLQGDEDMGRVAAAVRKALRVEAAVDVEDVRREYYDSLGQDQMWWWIRAIRIDPAEMIVDDDEGSLYRVPYAVSGDTVTFGDAVEVVIQYVDAPAAGKTAARGAERDLVVYATRDEARPGRVRAHGSDGGDGMTETQLKAIGLPADATDEQIDARLAALAALDTSTPPADDTGEDDDTGGEQPVVTTPPADAPVVPITPAADGTVTMDAAAVEELRVAAAQGVAARTRQLTEDRDRFIGDAIKAGKFPVARRDNYVKLWDVDPDGTKAMIDTLAAGMVPVSEIGSSIDPDGAAQDDGYPTTWLPEVHANRQPANANR